MFQISNRNGQWSISPSDAFPATPCVRSRPHGVTRRPPHQHIEQNGLYFRGSRGTTTLCLITSINTHNIHIILSSSTVTMARPLRNLSCLPTLPKLPILGRYLVLPTYLLQRVFHLLMSSLNSI